MIPPGSRADSTTASACPKNAACVSDVYPRAFSCRPLSVAFSMPAPETAKWMSCEAVGTTTPLESTTDATTYASDCPSAVSAAGDSERDSASLRAGPAVRTSSRASSWCPPVPSYPTAVSVPGSNGTSHVRCSLPVDPLGEV